MMLGDEIEPPMSFENVDIFEREPRYLNGMFGILKNESLSKLV